MPDTGAYHRKGEQKSQSNPGWNGSGIPELRTFLLKRPKQIFSTGIRSLPNGKNLLYASLADLWNFYLNPFGKAQCPCCGWQGKSFIASANWREVSLQSRCPQCDSRSRHRGQKKYLQSYATDMFGRKTLIFAPEKVILDALMDVGVEEIFTTDYNSVDVDLPNEDIQKLSLDSNSFELLICNHVLEHVANDQAGIDECSRVLTDDGIALFTIPGDYSKEKTWYFEKVDSNGHYRHYGLDVMQKFRQNFSQASMIDMSDIASPIEHVRRQDMLFVCRKT